MATVVIIDDCSKQMFLHSFYCYPCINAVLLIFLSHQLTQCIVIKLCNGMRWENFLIEGIFRHFFPAQFLMVAIALLLWRVLHRLVRAEYRFS